MGDLKPCLPERLFTKDKKVQVAPQVFIDDLPRLKSFLQSSLEETESAKEFDLLIISRLTTRTLGWMHHSKRLVKGKNPVRLQMHPDDALARGIADGANVSVTSARTTLPPGCVVLDVGS